MKLGKRQESIYEFLLAYTAEHGYPPSVREIGAAVGLASPSTVHMHLKSLEESGFIRRNSKKPRTIELIDAQHSKSSVVSVQQDLDRGIMMLPLVGRVAAGEPILAEQNIEDVVALPTAIVGDASAFVLRVTGESMIEAGIFSGDYIIVNEEHDAKNGDIVVALVDDSATVKRFFKEEHRVRLQPENSTMEPIYVENPQILGRVTGLIRSL